MLSSLAGLHLFKPYIMRYSKTKILLLTAVLSISYGYSQKSLFEPYGKDWFSDLAPKDRSVTHALLKAIRAIEGNDSMQSIALKVMPDPSSSRPNLKLIFAHFASSQNPWPPLSVYVLSYDENSSQYLIRNQPPPQPGQLPDIDVLLVPAPPGYPVPQPLLSSSKYDLNGDGRLDRIDGSVISYAQPSSDIKWDKSKFPPLEVFIKIYLDTEVGLIEDENIAQSVFDYRIGYIAGYSTSFNAGFSKSVVSQNNAPSNATVATYKLPAANPNFDPSKINYPSTEDLTYDSTIICSKYEDISKRKFLNFQRNQLLYIGLQKGIAAGKADAQLITAKIAKLTGNKFVKSTKAPDASETDKAVEYDQLRSDLVTSLMNTPLFRISFKNRKTGEVKYLLDGLMASSDNVQPVDKSNSLYADFIAKIKRPVTQQTSAAFFKPAETNGDWYLLSPGLLSGQATAYVNILALVNDKKTMDQIRATDPDGNYWLSLMDNFQSQLMKYSDDDIAVLGSSVVGVNSLLFREGYRNATLYLIKANSEVSFDQGKTAAVTEIIDYLRTSFPQFHPPADITTTEQAKVAIGGFISGLYSVINQMDGTIKNLNTLLLNANDRVTQLQSVINNLNDASRGLAKTTNVIGNTLEVAYWGSSVGGIYTLGDSIGRWTGWW